MDDARTITEADAVRQYPELARLMDIRDAGWVFRPLVDQHHELMGLVGSSSACQYTDAISIAARSSPERADIGRHDGHHDNAVTVAELLARTAAEGRALRLNWPATATDPHGVATVDHVAHGRAAHDRGRHA
ncbi:hypothetical protein LX15_000917 [Streptoalloteichus tenebrarius]|uniref:Uncharacterized protein n=1 Tax=Streptoalloteichus tenebrarius (strain ATCC 17920 / DSM 40477 / JCM 4838 / CBS 697.72 / NBRC 16177 / NCIMB 11028 / NRRL B-12390 / A12253. 1 / ISP 5477) TaxID=1933 RepID=A0ABT1HNZ6_STRSD|nr:hypothetical protein [Streptoalloteichus tenebrarius]MCP2257232.1 hypothetical protein [Streptoalloteichus tenebrarius]BFE98870.1 hypothetical protein GCM10020241_05460 [Streptoalloteichus tenebrarius]